MFRLFGRGTSTSELFEYIVETPNNPPKRSLVLISETVQGPPPNPKNPPQIDLAQLSELFLSLPLLLPGDMRGANLIVTPEDELISIDNDVSWVKPYTKESCNFYTILPFFYPDFVLHPEAIAAFLTLKPIPLLMSWLEELIVYNNMILGDPRLQAYEEISKTAFFNPQLYTSTCSFQRGTGGQLISQFYRLQEFLQKNQHRLIKGAEVLQTIISIDENQISQVGKIIYDKYERAQKLKIETADKVKWVTGRKNSESMSMTQSQASFYGHLPKNTDEIKDYSPKLAYEEIKQLAVLNFKGFFFQSEGKLATLERGMEGIDPNTQKYLFKVFVLHTYEHLNLSNSILTDTDLEAFLGKSGESLKILDLRHCPHLTDKSISLIIKHCTALKKLYLSRCLGIKRFLIPRWVGTDPVRFPKLQTLHLSHCPSLTTFNIEALKLKVLKVDNNPRLTKGVLEAPGCEVISENSPLKLEWGIASQTILRQQQQKVIEQYGAFGKKKWEQFFGDSGIEPILPPNIQEILNTPCPIWPSKKVYETHLLTLIPQTINGQPLTLKTLGELVQKPLHGPAMKYRGLYPGDYKDPPTPASHWTLFSRDVIPNSRSKTFDGQKQLVPRYPGYEIPHILDATVSIFMEHVKSSTRLYSTYTRCQEKWDADWQLAVGGFGGGGLDVLNGRSGGNENYGVGLSREF